MIVKLKETDIYTISMFSDSSIPTVRSKFMKEIFSGRKSDFLNKSEFFWSFIVEKNKEYGKIWIYKDYLNGRVLFTAKESGLSAINSISGEYYSIIKVSKR